MFKSIPESHRDLLSDEKKAFAFLATIMPDGSPQLTPVWFDTKDEFIRINTARGRVKDRNMTARPKVTLAIMDPGNPYRYIQIRASVARASEKGARAHIDRLAGKYLGTPAYGDYQGETRVTYLLQPVSVSTMG